MFKTPVLALIALLALAAAQVRADPVTLVVRSAEIASTKANNACWDFAPGRRALPDPFIKAWVYDTDGAHADYGETVIDWDTLEPEWNKELVKVRAGQRIMIEVWDKDVKYDDLIGRHTFTITAAMIAKGSLNDEFNQVTSLRIEFRGEAKAAPRVVMQQPFPGPNSAKKLTRTKDRERAVVLVHGLHLRDDGDDPAIPRFVDWQGSTSPLVRALSKHADVFAISYAQNAPIEEIASYPELRESIDKVKKLGYREVVLFGHSAGGILARHLVEEHPRVGVTRVIQIATPNSGTKLAGLAVNLFQVPKGQATFVASLAPAHRAEVLKQRRDKKIPETIDFVAVIASSSPKANGDGAINRQCQWPSDLQDQGIPAICLQASHMGVMADDACLEVYCRLVTQSQPRWTSSKVEQFASTR